MISLDVTDDHENNHKRKSDHIQDCLTHRCDKYAKAKNGQHSNNKRSKQPKGSKFFDIEFRGIKIFFSNATCVAHRNQPLTLGLHKPCFQ